MIPSLANNINNDPESALFTLMERRHQDLNESRNIYSTTNKIVNMSLLENMESQNENETKRHFHQTNPIAFIERYCSRLNINQELTKVCQFVAFRIESQKIIPENTPHSVAAGIVYFVAQCCLLNISKKDIKRLKTIQLELHEDFIKVVEKSRGSKLKKDLGIELFSSRYCEVGSKSPYWFLAPTKKASQANAKVRNI